MATYPTYNKRTNYSRLCRAIIDLCSGALRDMLGNQAHPANLETKLKCCTDVRLKKDEWKTIKSASTLGSFHKFDISLLYQVLRLLSTQELRNTLKRQIPPGQLNTDVQNCLALISDPGTKLSQDELNDVKYVASVGTYDHCKDNVLLKLYNHLCRIPIPNCIHPTQSWGENPGPNDVQPGDDVERIRVVRNSIYGHISTTEVSDVDFNTHWNVLENIMTRLNRCMAGGHYREDLDEIKFMCMDDTLEKWYHNEMEKSSLAETEMQKQITLMKTNIQDTKSDLQSGIQMLETHLKTDMEKLKSDGKLDNEALKQSFVDLNKDIVDALKSTNESIKENTKYIEDSKQRTSESFVECTTDISSLKQNVSISFIDFRTDIANVKHITHQNVEECTEAIETVKQDMNGSLTDCKADIQTLEECTEKSLEEYKKDFQTFEHSTRELIQKSEAELKGVKESTELAFAECRAATYDIKLSTKDSVTECREKIESVKQSTTESLKECMADTENLKERTIASLTECKEDMENMRQSTRQLLHDSSQSVNTKIKHASEEVNYKLEELKTRIADDKDVTHREKTPLEEQTLALIFNHRNDKTFVTTKAVEKGMELLTENGILIYTGLPGDGKTENAYEIMHQFYEAHPEWVYEEYDSIPRLSDIQGDVNSVVLFDDCLGKSNTNISLFDDQNTKCFDEIFACIKTGKVKVILTIRKNILIKNASKLEKYELFKEGNIIDLSSEMYRLTKSYKNDILMSHFRERNIQTCDLRREANYKSINPLDTNMPVQIDNFTISNITDTSPDLGFPYCCFLFCCKRKYTRLGMEFFRKPSQNLIEEIESLVQSESSRSDKIQYCIMAYMMLKGEGDVVTSVDFNSSSKVRDLCDLSPEMRQNLDELKQVKGIDLNTFDTKLFSQVADALNINQPLDREIKDAIDELNHTYLVQADKDKTFKFKHQTILESVAYCFYDDNASLLLKLCSDQFINEYIRPEKYEKSDGEIIIFLKQNDYRLLIERLIGSLKHGNDTHVWYEIRYSWWLSHSLIDDAEFVDCLVGVFNSDDQYKEIVQKYVDVIMQSACDHGKTYLIDKLYNSFKVDNKTLGKSLNSACANCHTNTVLWLLDHQPDLPDFSVALRVSANETLTAMINHPVIALDDVINVLQLVVEHGDSRTVECILRRWPNIDHKNLTQIMFYLCMNNMYKSLGIIFQNRPEILTNQNITIACKWANGLAYLVISIPLNIYFIYNMVM